MALTEKRVIHSLEYLFDFSTVNLCWKDQILRDGEVINETPHRGAYPVDAEGRIQADIVGLDGLKVTDIIGEDMHNQALRMQQALASLTEANQNLAAERDEVERLRGQVAGLSAQLDDAKVALAGLSEQLRISEQNRMEPTDNTTI